MNTFDPPHEPPLLQGLMSEAQLSRRSSSVTPPASNEALFDEPAGLQGPKGRQPCNPEKPQ